MDEEVYTVEDIFERDTPLTENLLDNSDGLTLSPITMLRRYMAKKELQKQNEKIEDDMEMDEESMGYMNGGGIGSMMQPRQNYAIGGDIEQSDFGLQNIINYDLPGNQNTQTAGFFSSDAENALENIQDLRNQQNIITKPVGGDMELLQQNDIQYNKFQNLENEIEQIKQQNINDQEFKDIGGQTARLSYDKLNNGTMTDANTSLFNQENVITPMSKPVTGITNRNRGQIISRNDPFAGMNALERDLAQVRMNTSQEDFNNLATDRFKEMNGINFIDQPINNIFNRKDNPAVGILDKFRSQQNPDASLMNKIFSGSTKQYPKYSQNLENKNKLGDLFTSAKEGIMNTGQRFKEGASKVPSLFVQAANYRNPLNPKAANYNPNLVGQLNALDGMTGTVTRGQKDKEGNYKTIGGSMLTNNPNTGLLQYGPGSVLRGKNAISGFGTNDYGDQLDEYIEKMKSRAIKKDLSQFQTKKLADAIAERQRENDRASAAAAAAADAARARAPAFNPNTTSGGRGSYRSDRDNSSDGGYGGSSKRSADNRSSDLGFSDIRLKDNIKLVGKSPSDINIYNFTYLNNPTVYQGVMAQEVPWASVKHDNGYLMVDYNKVDVDFKRQ